ncbi:DUF885 domain-containing protein [Flammeovirga pectinis]|uniref:DUF885 domain-containing protein n=1 Tax=Flammeovirga pectinis TaxID=2494373 RepID=A0A3S9NZ66_9BACT|nr:DUF885 domain-containing protein [Flammeovirga pectinis]AZQ61217.1 DUF885 domain-containing protein [Flammeovirga pectinis]
MTINNTRLLLLSTLFSFTFLISCQKTIENKISKNDDLHLDVFFDSVFLSDLNKSPESLTYRGDKFQNDEWDDYSESAFYRTFRDKEHALNESKKFNSLSFSPSRALSLKLFQDELKLNLDGERYHMYEYTFNQMFGAQSESASFLIGFHQIDSKKDAEAYIERIKKIPELMQQKITKSEMASEVGFRLPKFLFPKVLGDCENLLKGKPLDKSSVDHPLVSDFNKKLSALKLPPNEEDQLKKDMYHAMVYYYGPTYRKLIHYLKKEEKLSNDEAGVWRLKDGDEYYAYCLKKITSTDLTASQIHDLGLKEVERIHNEMQIIKEKVGFEGDLQAFFEFMKSSPQFYYANTTTGKQEYLHKATAIIDTMRTRLDDLFITKPKAEIIVKRVEEFREATAGKAFYNKPAKDGSRPGYYYANLYDMEGMPKYEMEALAYHEGIPGHHMQLALTQELSDLPEFRKSGEYTAYIEGWGLYAEFIPKELGFYSDPYSDFGRLSMELWRSCRLVVDTGIHDRKWTREESITYYTSNTPAAYSQCEKMVDRHIVMPGQATAYKIGMDKILKLRDKSKNILGSQFDIRQFHEVVLSNGPIPLSTLEFLVENYIQKNNQML